MIGIEPGKSEVTKSIKYLIKKSKNFQTVKNKMSLKVSVHVGNIHFLNFILKRNIYIKIYSKILVFHKIDIIR